MTNYQKGYSFEALTIRELREDPKVFIADRFLKSVGPVWKPDYENLNRWGNYKSKHAPVDIWWLTEDGMNFAQNKKGVFISTAEMLDLVMFSWDMEKAARVHLITRMKKKTHTWQISNKTIQ